MPLRTLILYNKERTESKEHMDSSLSLLPTVSQSLMHPSLRSVPSINIPQFHRQVMERPLRNVQPFFCGCVLLVVVVVVWLVVLVEQFGFVF